MTREEHIERHKLLHKHLDELLADFIDNTGKMPSKTTLLEFLHWSHSQTTDPAETWGARQDKEGKGSSRK